MTLEALEEEIRACTNCPLCRTRKNAVPGTGNPHATLMLIGEAPGRQEDERGEPFVGRAGRLLSEILAEIGIGRDEVYITNVVKCRPPGNRTPRASEVRACMPYLRRQISLIGPRIMVLLGMVPAKTVLGMYGIRFTSMGEMVGKVFHVDDVILVPCYHPAAALYNPRLVDRIRETLRKVGELYQK